MRRQRGWLTGWWAIFEAIAVMVGLILAYMLMGYGDARAAPTVEQLEVHAAKVEIETIARSLPEGVEMIHGPGCPVCVTPLETIDRALAIAATPGVIFCSFGDMLRVPGSREDLFSVRARGGVIWRVHRAAATPVRAHASEAEIEDIKPDWHIHNNGSFEDLRETVGEALKVTLT
mgnify:CR=1 FL=1